MPITQYQGEIPQNLRDHITNNIAFEFYYHSMIDRIFILTKVYRTKFNVSFSKFSVISSLMRPKK
jgi:hypothetical protein